MSGQLDVEALLSLDVCGTLRYLDAFLARKKPKDASKRSWKEGLESIHQFVKFWQLDGESLLCLGAQGATRLSHRFNSTLAGCVCWNGFIELVCLCAEAHSRWCKRVYDATAPRRDWVDAIMKKTREEPLFRIPEVANPLLWMHDEMNHLPEQYSRALKSDWSTAPRPYRRFVGCCPIPLDRFRTTKLASPLYSEVMQAMEQAGTPGAHAPLSWTTLSLFLFLSVSTSAIRTLADASSSWTRRVHPSAGALHPIDTFLVVPGSLLRTLARVHTASNNFPMRSQTWCSLFEALLAKEHTLSACSYLLHYSPLEHTLELCCRVSYEHTSSRDSVSVILTAAHWRQLWRYGERGLRYSLCDLGHAAAALCLSAAATGLRMHRVRPKQSWLSAIHTALRGCGPIQEEQPLLFFALTRAGETPVISEAQATGVHSFVEAINTLSLRTHNWALARCAAALLGPSTFVPLAAKCEWCCVRNDEVGEPSSPGFAADLPLETYREDVARLFSGNTAAEGVAHKAAPAESVRVDVTHLPLIASSFASVVRSRRSAHTYGERRSFPLSALIWLLHASHPLCRKRSPPFAALRAAVDERSIVFAVYAQCVDGLRSGVYAFGTLAAIQACCGTPPQARVYRLGSSELTCCSTGGDECVLVCVHEMSEREASVIATKEASCEQYFVSQGYFSLVVLANLAVLRASPCLYAEAHYLAAAAIHLLYLHAEAWQKACTGLGCYMDSLVTKRFIHGAPRAEYRPLYSFTLGERAPASHKYTKKTLRAHEYPVKDSVPFV